MVKSKHRNNPLGNNTSLSLFPIYLAWHWYCTDTTPAWDKWRHCNWERRGYEKGEGVAFLKCKATHFEPTLPLNGIYDALDYNDISSIKNQKEHCNPLEMTAGQPVMRYSLYCNSIMNSHIKKTYYCVCISLKKQQGVSKLEHVFIIGLANNLQWDGIQLLPWQQFPSLSPTLFSALLENYLMLMKSHSLNAPSEVSADARKQRNKLILYCVSSEKGNLLTSRIFS